MSQEPPQDGPSGSLRWADYLDWVRADICRTVLGLTTEQQRTARVPSGWTPLELLSHCLHMERRWFVWGFLGEPVDDPWGDWTDGTVAPARWVVADGVTAADLADRLERIGERTRGVLSDFAPDTTAAVGGRFSKDPPTLEWICFHVLAEYARHAGHLDIVVELSGAQAGTQQMP